MKIAFGIIVAIIGVAILAWYVAKSREQAYIEERIEEVQRDEDPDRPIPSREGDEKSPVKFIYP